MIVADASAVLNALTNDGHARQRLLTESLVVPHLIDSEIVHVCRRLVRTGQPVATVDGIIDTWSKLAVHRLPLGGVLYRMWELRDALSAYDASYVALAESLDIALVTADARISRAAGVRCVIEVLPD